MPSINSGGATPQRTPTLIPDFDTPVVKASPTGKTSTVSLDDNISQYLTDFPAAEASGSFTVATAGTAGDIITVSMKRGSITSTVTATVPATPTVTTVAQAIVTAINNGNIPIDASNIAGVITLEAQTAGQGGNGYVITVTTNGNGTFTGLTSNALTLSGGTGPITPLEDFQVVLGKSIIALYANRPVNASVQLAAAIIASGRNYK